MEVSVIKEKKKRARKKTMVAWSFILPNLIGYLIFTFIPIMFSFLLAFAEWDSFSPIKFVGFDNFKFMLADKTFWISITNTFKYTAFVVPLTMICALGLALLLNKKVKGIAIFRTMFFFPYITSLVAVAVVWNMLFHPSLGPINQVLLKFMDSAPGWTTKSQWALTAVIIVSVWRFMGYYMILYLAGLQGIPKELYEASAIDGAGKIRQFFDVTLPSLRPTTFFVLIMLTINSFKVFDLVQVMTDGGPGRSTNVLVYQIYQEAFVNYKFGYASAVSLVLFVIVLAITIIQFRIEKKNK